MVKFLPIVIGLICLTGCRVGPDYVAPTPIDPPSAAHYLHGDGAMVSNDQLHVWWTQFNDPLLSELIDTGLKVNPSLLIAMHRLNAARALRDATDANDRPTISADGSYREARSGGANQTAWTSSVVGSVDARWELDFFGGLERALERSEAELMEQEYTLDDAQVVLVANIASAYFNYRRNQRLLETTQLSLDLRRRTIALGETRNAAGTVSLYNLTRSRALEKSVAASIPMLQAQMESAGLLLDSLLGTVPHTHAAKLAAEAQFAQLPKSIPTLLPNDLLRQRPDIRIAETAIRKQTAQIGIDTATIYPKFMLTGSLGVSSPEVAPWQDYSRLVSGGPSFSWNIFAFGYWRKILQYDEHMLQASVESYRQTVLEAYRESETAWQDYSHEIVRDEPLREAIAYREQALDIASKLYDSGLDTYDDVITCEQDLLVAQDLLIEHHYKCFSNLITLYRSLGGGWSDTL